TTDEQKQRWLPKFVSGEYITAIAMSEPGVGSDLANLRTTAKRAGDHYVINGSKTFISNGLLADLVVVACRTDTNATTRPQGISNPIGTFQVNRHALAQITIDMDVMQNYVDACIMGVNSGELTADEAAGAKWWATETQWKIMDRCLQLHGGYGYMNEYEVA